MILTCPDCATSYFVDDSKIPRDGRTVKCASCGTRWTARHETALELDVTEDEGAVAREAVAPAPEPEVISDLPGEALPKVFRAKAETGRKVREAATVGVVWGVMAVAMALMIGTAVLFRVDVVKAWPQSAAAYAGIGLPVNSLGLVIEGEKAEPALQEGHAAIAISGMIRNVESHAIETPPLKISLLNKAGKPVATKIARPADGLIPPGETRHFALSMLDPPSSADQVEIAFAPEAARAGAHGPSKAHAAPKPAAHKAATMDLRGPTAAPEPAMPEPVDAQPLPEVHHDTPAHD